MKIDDNYILITFWSGKILHLNKKEFNDDVKEYLINRFSDFESFKETIYRIKYNIIERSICAYCGGKVKFIGKTNYLYHTFCSKECKHNSGLVGIHMKQTKLEKYGNENFVNPNKTKQTKLEKYGNSGYHNLDKTKQTCLEKYGCENVFSNKNIIKKLKQTKLERYGDENYVNSNKTKQTKLERYGDENYVNIEKIKQTCLNRYGYEFPLKSNIIKNKIDWNKLIQKQIETKRKNNTFNKSEKEDQSYELLKEKYLDVIRQYRSKSYPFNCDFYIPSLDLYIECNYHWTHGGKLYEGTEQDNKLLQHWKDKNTKYYNNAIKTWTYSDIKKYNTAKENKLNYIIFYQLNQLKLWINNNENQRYNN